MHVELERRYTLDIEPERIWHALTEPERIAECIPYRDDVHVEGRRLRARVKPPYSFIKGRMSIDSEIIDVDDAARRLRIMVKGSSIGSSFDAVLTVSIMHDGLTAAIVADTHGLLRTVPGSLIERIVEDTAERFISCIKSMLVNAQR